MANITSESYLLRHLYTYLRDFVVSSEIQHPLIMNIILLSLLRKMPSKFKRNMERRMQEEILIFNILLTGKAQIRRSSREFLLGPAGLLQAEGLTLLFFLFHSDFYPCWMVPGHLPGSCPVRSFVSLFGQVESLTNLFCVSLASLLIPFVSTSSLDAA